MCDNAEHILQHIRKNLHRGLLQSVTEDGDKGHFTFYFTPFSTVKIYFYQVIFFFFLWPHLQHMEVPRLGVESRTAAASLRHSHSNARSEPCLRPTPQLMATLDP